MKTAQGPVPAQIDAAFSAGATVFALGQILNAAPGWIGAWRMRQALKATVAAARILRLGRVSLGGDEAGLRDTLHLTRVPDDPGPAGRLHERIRRIVSQPLRQARETLAGDDGEIERLLGADCALAERLGWAQLLPLHLTAILDPTFRQGETGRRPRVGEPGWEQVQHTVLARAGIAAHAEAVNFNRRAQTLVAAAETLRTRGSAAGLALILGDDCVAPWRMVSGANGVQAGLGSDRAARRFCESLHARGALRLLTNRPTFRLYGL
jgi:hypothetical protein